jgi:hypothetical protein
LAPKAIERFVILAQYVIHVLFPERSVQVQGGENFYDPRAAKTRLPYRPHHAR